LNYKKIENLNRLKTTKGTEPILKNFPTKKSPGADGFTNGLCHMFKELMP
jgi:hypothetical protein